MEATDSLTSPEGAQALGWYLYRRDDVVGAEGWFRKSAQWSPSESAAVGLVVSARKLHHRRRLCLSHRRVPRHLPTRRRTRGADAVSARGRTCHRERSRRPARRHTR